MKLYEFTPNETGFNSFYVVSTSKDEAIESLKTLSEEYSDPEHFFNDREKYTIKEYGVNKPTWVLNC